MRAEWQRIEADVKLLAKWEGDNLYALHELGYHLTDRIGDLTPMQKWTLIAVWNRVLKQIKDQRKTRERRTSKGRRRR